MKTYKLTGHCLVPHQVEMTVTAESEEEAKRIGLERFKANTSRYVVSNSGDNGAAFDWEPYAEVDIDWKARIKPQASTPQATGE